MKRCFQHDSGLVNFMAYRAPSQIYGAPTELSWSYLLHHLQLPFGIDQPEIQSPTGAEVLNLNKNRVLSLL